MPHPDPLHISGAPMTVTMAGRTLKVYPLTTGDWLGPVQDWIDRQQIDPFDVVSRQIERGRAVVRDGKPAREPYTITQQQFMLKNAIEQATRGRVLLGTPEASELLTSFEGMVAVFWISVQKGDPSFTEADARAILKDIDVAQMARIFRGTQANMVADDPKAGTGTTMTPDGMTTHSTATAETSHLTGGKRSTRSPKDHPPSTLTP